MEEILGMVKLFAGNFAPLGFMKCDGQTLSISQNQALFSILGTTYGGNGTVNFVLPKLAAPEGMSYVICVAGIYPPRP